MSDSLAYNDLTNHGEDLSALLKLAEILPSTSITSLKCAPRHLYTTLR